LLPVGRVAGHRGRGGEITIKVYGGDAEFWTGLERIWLGNGEPPKGRFIRVQEARAYRDKLVLKLEGIDGATAAARLRGSEAMAAGRDAPRLPEGVHYTARLIGMEVRDEQGNRLGRVHDLVRTGGADLLLVRPGNTEDEASEDTREIMIPLAEGIVIDVREEEGRITVSPPDGLLELNRAD
jgi:16S rRNA processing protein RimM